MTRIQKRIIRKNNNVELLSTTGSTTGQRFFHGSLSLLSYRRVFTRLLRLRNIRPLPGRERVPSFRIDRFPHYKRDWPNRNSNRSWQSTRAPSDNVVKAHSNDRGSNVSGTFSSDRPKGYATPPKKTGKGNVEILLESKLDSYIM